MQSNYSTAFEWEFIVKAVKERNSVLIQLCSLLATPLIAKQSEADNQESGIFQSQ